MKLRGGQIVRRQTKQRSPEKKTDAQITHSFVGYQDTVSIRVRETACTDNASAFIIGRECARVLLQAPTIYLALPLVCAQLQLYFGKRVCLKDRE
jgi:hypothetical protein